MRNKMVLWTLLFFTPLAPAATMQAEVKGGQFRWKSANTYAANQYVPSQWDIEGHLPPTSEWVPGALSGSSPSTLTLTFGSNNVTVNAKVVGIEYHTGSVIPVKGDAQSNRCQGQMTSGSSVIGLVGVGCGASHSLTYGTAHSPYSFIRPIVEVDTTALAQAFTGQPEGVYRGVVNASSFYDYIVDASGARTRRNSSHTMVLEVEHIPAFLSDVQVQGDGVMKAWYDYHSDTTRGETQFAVTATGWFVNGLSVSLRQGRTNYEMDGPSNSFIPYSITCLECADVELVKNGVPVNYQTLVHGATTNSMNVNFKVGFENVDVMQLHEGAYSDMFVLVFEPNF